MTKSAAGSGSIRKKTVTRNGKEYQFWEARLTVGYDPGDGHQIQKSFTAKTQAEARRKLQAAAVELDRGDYREPSKLTVAAWLDIWLSEFCTGVKPRTKDSYTSIVEEHLKPTLGSLKLTKINHIDIQRAINHARNAVTGDALSPKSLRNVHGVLHKALAKALTLGYIRVNPAENTELPAASKPEITPFNSSQTKSFLAAIRGHRLEALYATTLFTGLRQGEVMGLTWDCIDFDAGRVLVKQQLQNVRGSGGEYALVPTKSDRWRVLTPAPYVMQLLERQRSEQARMRREAGSAWNNPMNLVFTDELGTHLSTRTVYRCFKQLAAEAGMPDARFHDLRHTYATTSLINGDNLRAVQDALGHATATFTMQVYGHTTDEARRQSAERMQQYINELNKE